MTKHDTINNPLGQEVVYPTSYNPRLLCPIPRQVEEGNQPDAQYYGVDLWTGYEISWLDRQGKPQVRIGEFSISCYSPNLIESKSFKLYLNSLNNQPFATEQDIIACLQKDLSNCAGVDVGIQLRSVTGEEHVGQPLVGKCLDDLDIEVSCYTPEPSLLNVIGTDVVTETLYSHLLKTNCPVTNQPDWATLWLHYTGVHIDPAGLLKYLVSFRDHQDFHEQCVEKIYQDIMRYCQPEKLQVFGRYTRRGGLDINPFRCSEPGVMPPNMRIARQ